jgi:hypothetical protein
MVLITNDKKQNVQLEVMMEDDGKRCDKKPFAKVAIE